MQRSPREDEWAPVAFASRSLTDTEQRYSQIEKEAIAIHWGCHHFHLYVYGKPFVVATDHKPLVALFTGTSSKLPPRIEKWMLQLQNYNCKVEYQPGSRNPVDYLSRHPRPATAQEEEDAEDTEEYVRYIAARSCPLPISMEGLSEETAKDECLQRALKAVEQGSWHRERET